MANRAKVITLKKNKHLISIHKTGDKKKLRYNLKSKSLEVYHRGNKVWNQVQHQYGFFRDYNINDIRCSDEKFKVLIKKTAELNPLCRSLSSFIVRLHEALVYENYMSENIDVQCDVYRGGYGSVNRSILTKPLEFYSKNTITFIKKHKIEITLSMEQRFIEDKKFMEKFVDILTHCDITDEQRKEFFEYIINRYTFETFFALVDTYSYDIKSLIHYLYNYLEPFENVGPSDAMSTLQDYYEMAHAIGRDVKKYPKYLRSMHDIITANHNAYKRNYNISLFKEAKRPELAFEGKKYCIIIPNVPKDIIREGTDLNHCVGSYVDKIIEKKTYIFFLRETKTKETSLVTLELMDNSITTAKGAYNRALNEQEKKFLESYCNKMKLQIQI